MPTLFTRTVFAGASIALTAAMVAASAPAYAEQVSDARQIVVKSADLNLGNAAGRATLAKRVSAAADAVCHDDDGLRPFAQQRCRSDALEQAHAEMDRMSRGAND